MRTADLVVGILLIGLGGVVVTDALRLGIGWSTDGPRSGFFPFWLATLMITGCAGIVVQAARRGRRGVFVSREQLVPVLKVLAPATAMVVATQIVGLYVAGCAYLAVYMRWVGGHSWTTVVLISVAVPVATFLLFETWFLVPMPKGPLEAWLGY